ncbi:hypothetical protein N7490_002217 [Penicillium lividum]|nr:hypothetical protein N7490_002217 [Penicillium lividum]
MAMGNVGTYLQKAANVRATTSALQANSDTQSLEERNERQVLDHPDEVTQDAQIGVQKAEATALVWSRTALYATYAWIWLCFFVLSMQSSIGSNVMYYAYANFASAPQISQAFIILQLPIAKALNLWGRAEDFLLFLVVFILGLIVIASCNGPNGFAAGYTLYWIGYTAMNFILSAFIGTPSICTAFTGPLAAQAFINHSTWRRAYGCFAIITTIVFKLNLFIRVPSGRTTTQSFVHYFHEFDIIGAFILTAAFILFLLPFSLNTYGFTGYSSATFIAMVVIGILLFPVFATWERFFVRTAFIKWELFKKRTVVGACILSAVIFLNYFTWDQYFYHYIQVVYNLDAAKTGYMTQIYGVGSTILAVLFGVVIRQTRHFKNLCLSFGVPLFVLGAALMIHFRGSQSNIGYLVMCQIFIAFGGGTLVIADRDGVPLMIAIISLASSFGEAIGYAIAVAIYSNTFPQALLSALPDSTKADCETFYLGGSATQLLYPPGSETRIAINYAWAYSQKYLCITAAAMAVLAFPVVAIWKNYDVDKKQVKGTVI